MHRMLPSSVYWYESGLQNQVATMTDFCVSKIGVLLCALCCYCVLLVVAPWHFEKLWEPNHHKDRSRVLGSITQGVIIFSSQETWQVLCFPF